jgi:hypothetical protein
MSARIVPSFTVLLLALPAHGIEVRTAPPAGDCPYTVGYSAEGQSEASLIAFTQRVVHSTKPSYAGLCPNVISAFREPKCATLVAICNSGERFVVYQAAGVDVLGFGGPIGMTSFRCYNPKGKPDPRSAAPLGNEGFYPCTATR